MHNLVNNQTEIKRAKARNFCEKMQEDTSFLSQITSIQIYHMIIEAQIYPSTFNQSKLHA